MAGNSQHDTGVLLIHGFSGAPDEVQPLGVHLLQLGYTVSGPLLPQHGGPPMNLRGAKWQDWVAAAANALQHLRQSCDKIVLCGLSMGGLIALQLAQPQSGAGRIDGIVLMATPVALRNRLAGLSRFAKYVVPYFGPLDRANFNEPRIQTFVRRQLPPGTAIDFNDKQSTDQIRKRARIPLDAVDQLLQLNKRCVAALPQVHVPALIVQGRHDHVIQPHSAATIYQHIASPDKHLLWLDNSAHMLPLESDKAQLFEAVTQFVQRVTNASA